MLLIDIGVSSYFFAIGYNLLAEPEHQLIPVGTLVTVCIHNFERNKVLGLSFYGHTEQNITQIWTILICSV